MQFTLTIDDQLLTRAQGIASKRGMDLDELVRELLERVAREESSRPEDEQKHEGWERVFGKARPEDVAEVDAIIAEEFERIDLDTWQ